MVVGLGFKSNIFKLMVLHNNTSFLTISVIEQWCMFCLFFFGFIFICQVKIVNPITMNSNSKSLHYFYVSFMYVAQTAL